MPNAATPADPFDTWMTYTLIGKQGPRDRSEFDVLMAIDRLSRRLPVTIKSIPQIAHEARMGEAATKAAIKRLRRGPFLTVVEPENGYHRGNARGYIVNREPMILAVCEANGWDRETGRKPSNLTVVRKGYEIDPLSGKGVETDPLSDPEGVRNRPPEGVRNRPPIGSMGLTDLGLPGETAAVSSPPVTREAATNDDEDSSTPDPEALTAAKAAARAAVAARNVPAPGTKAHTRPPKTNPCRHGVENGDDVTQPMGRPCSRCQRLAITRQALDAETHPAPEETP